MLLPHTKSTTEALLPQESPNGVLFDPTARAMFSGDPGAGRGDKDAETLSPPLLQPLRF